MKIALTFPCDKCGKLSVQEVELHDETPTWNCPHCNTPNSGFFDSQFTIGSRILQRSLHELIKRRDVSMAIVFAAMAVDCELSRLFVKWKEIEALDNGVALTEDELEEMLRTMGSSKDKLTKVTQLLIPQGIDWFVSKTPEIDEIVKRFPSIKVGSLAKNFQELIFWPRNRILHFGKSDDKQEDGERCCSIAQLGLLILKHMDKSRRQQ